MASLSPSSFCAVFDVDGVLELDGTLLPGADDAIKKIHKRQEDGSFVPAVPIVYVTNGCGKTEEDKARSLERSLGITVDPDQIVMGHTPMKELVPEYGNKRVLIVGKQGIIKVAQAYGFSNFLMPWQYAARERGVVPDVRYTQEQADETADMPDEPIQAVLVFQTPLDWGEALQVIVDVLRSDGHPGSKLRDIGTPHVPVYFSNPDVVYAGEYQWPRFTQGAFRLALDALYHALTGKHVQYTQYGKPHATTYRFAETALRRMRHKAWQVPETEALSQVFAVGDNPHSDIAGANAAGDHWTSILVQTGCWKEDKHHDEHVADHLVPHVRDAIALMLQHAA